MRRSGGLIFRAARRHRQKHNWQNPERDGIEKMAE